MKRISFFVPGVHTSSSGGTSEFSASELEKSVANYDPKLSEAPIVIGHPKTNDPAHGWIKSLNFEGGQLTAIPHQVNPNFSDLVQRGAYKKVSASWYLPNHPNNPTPGSLYLRHIGFLGAQPPAIKGLDAVEFSEGDEHVFSAELDFSEDKKAEEGKLTVEFSSFSFSRLARNIREYILSTDGKERADEVVPEFLVNDIEAEARIQQEQEAARQNTREPEPTFSENDPSNSHQKTKGYDMNKEELEAEQLKLKQDREKLDSDQASFSESKQRFEKKLADDRKERITSKIDSLIKDGKLLPAQREKVIAFCESLTDDVVNFTESNEQKSSTAVDMFIDFMESAGAKVPTDELSGGGSDDSQELNSKQLGKAINDYMDKKESEGVTVTLFEATQAVVNGDS